MTREEAITRIKDHIEIHRYHERNAVKIFEALDMAIKALEQEPSEAETKMSLPDGDELSKAIQNLEEIADEEDNIAYNLEPEQWMNIASCEKRAAYNRQLASWLRELKRLREQEPCEDAVSREIACQKMIDLYEEDYERYGVECFDCDRAIDVLRKLPSVTPKPQEYKTDHGYMWICPDCGLTVHSDHKACVRCGHER